MKLLFRTLLFHFSCIILFFLIYWNLGDHFLRDNKTKTPATLLDFLLLSTTVQAGVGIADIYPISFMGKLTLIIQQMIMLSTHVITLYIFTL